MDTFSQTHGQADGGAEPRGYTAPRSEAEVAVEIERRKSRFLAVLTRAQTADQAQNHLETLRRRHHEARHHCSAWVIGPQRDIRRSQDDGEPSGTAGAPMLEALTHATMPDGAQDLSDVVVVVVRWFGGTLLGAGGLVSAYSDATAAVVAEAAAGGHLVRRRQLRRHTVLAPVAEVGRWENELRGQGIAVDDTDYTCPETLSGQPAARLHLATVDTGEDSARLTALLASLSSGSATPQAGDTFWTQAS